MIFDKLSNLYLYRESIPCYDLVSNAIDDLQRRKGSVVLSEEIICNQSEYSTHDKGLKGYEIHKKHMDIQLLLDGCEIIDIADVDTLAPREKFNEEEDIGFFDGEKIGSIHISPGFFCILFPNEPHEPCLSSEDRHTIVKKVVFKINCTDYTKRDA